MRGTSGSTAIAISGKQYIKFAGVKILDYNNPPIYDAGWGISISNGSNNIIIDGVTVGLSGDKNIVIGGNSTNILVINSTAYNAQMSNFGVTAGNNITFDNDTSWIYSGYPERLKTDYGFGLSGINTHDIVVKNSLADSEILGGYGYAIGVTGGGITSGNPAHDIIFDNVTARNGVMGFELRDGAYNITIQNSYAENNVNTGFVSLNQGARRYNVVWKNNRARCNGTSGDNKGFSVESDSENFTLDNLIAWNCSSSTTDGYAFTLGGVNTVAAHLIAYGSKYGISGSGVTNFVSYGNSYGIKGTGFKNGILANNYRALYGASTTASYVMKDGNTVEDTAGSVCANCVFSDPLFADSANKDFHLKSQAGRWNGADWVIDTVTSPAIDAGDPASNYSLEPAINGNRINMGAYGNTVEASKSNSTMPTPAPVPMSSADLNFDGHINSVDFGIMMSYWNNTTKPKADINQDGTVNSVNFGIMMSEWG